MIARLLLLAPLAVTALPGPAAGQDLLLVTERGVTRFEAAGPRGHPAYPVTLLTRLGARTAVYGAFLVVRLYGDTLYFRTGYPDFRVNRTAVPLGSWTFEAGGTLYIPGRFFTEWLPARYPDRLRHAADTLTAGPVAQPESGGRQAPRAVRDSLRASRPPDTVTVRAPRTPRPARSPLPDSEAPGNGALVGFIDARLSGVYASNIDNQPAPRGSYGSVGRLGLGLRSSGSRPVLTVRYDLGLHRFPESDRWNRTTHEVSGLVAPTVGVFRPRVGAEARLGSLTEDRDFANQFQLRAGIEVHVTPRLRAHVYGEQGIQRITGTVERSDTARLAGVELLRRWSGGGAWRVDGRYLETRSGRPASRYTGWSGRGMLQLPLTRVDRLTLEVEHRRRAYSQRLVTVAGGEDLRRDQRWTPALSITHDVAGGALTVELEYEFEQNRSNDPDAAYLGHRVGLTLRGRW